MKKAMVVTSVFIVVFALAISFSPVQAKQLNLKLSFHFSPMGSTGSAINDYAKKITEQSNGRIKVTTYPSATLVAANDVYEAVKSGIADIGFTAVNTEPDAWPLNQVFVQPALGVPMEKKSVAFYKEAMNSSPELAQEMSDVKVLLSWNTGPETVIHTTKSLVRAPNDIVGMKIIGIGTFVNYLKTIKANPINLMPNDFFAALERGVAEGVMIPYTVMDITGITELLPYHLTVEIAAPRFFLIMNNDKWNGLSSEDQEMFNEANEWAVSEIIERSNAFRAKVYAKMKKLGHTVTIPTPEEVKLWQEGGIPMLQKWIDKNEAKGKPASKIFEQVKQIADKYR